jgi:DNA-binding transcriptional ArsR family regulator
MDRDEQALWLEWSGLPAALNKLRANGWLVFKTLVEIDCRAARRPGIVEVSVAELAERCGLTPEAVAKVVEALRKKKYLRCFLPDHPDETALIEIRAPIATPIPPEEVARRVLDPHLRDVLQYRYAHPPEAPADMGKIQEVVDLYLNRISQKMNSFILEQIEIVAARFAIEDIRRTVDRAARHEIRTIGWVLKELIREQGKKAGKK